MKRILVVGLAGAALAAAGCGGSSGGSTGTAASSGSASTSSSSGGASAPSGGGTVIDMKNIAFDPKSTTVKVGQKVTWDNLDSVDHNVTATSGASFKSKDYGNGGSFSFTPTKAGTIKYTCTIHPGMDGELIVK